jgi:hypothetical protein
MADEPGAVDVDERRDPPPESVTRTAAIPPGARLSPLQQAYSRYVTHTTGCDHCRDIDRGWCEKSERLHREWKRQETAAVRGLAGT